MSEKSDHDLLVEIHQVMKDPDNGVCRQVKKLNDAVFNEGWGIAAQTRIMWGIFCILGMAIVKLVVR